jgi:hypothetical protein
MRRNLYTISVSVVALAAVGVTGFIAFPTQADLELKSPLVAWHPQEPLQEEYSQDFSALRAGFTPQQYRSFCGPASIATIVKAYGSAPADQLELLPSISDKIRTFYTGMSLSRLAALAESAGMSTELIYADSLDVSAFRGRLKANMQQPGNFVVINYDRRVLNQAGAGHISAIGAYDPERDAFLVLDEASFKYPFTWVPTDLLYAAARTKAGSHYRGILIINEHRDRG